MAKRNKSSSSLFSQRKMKDLDALPPKRLAKYEDSLETLRLMRQNNMTLTKAAKTVQISPSTVKRNVGNALQKKGNRIIAKKDDNLLRKMRIYDNGKEVWIQIRGSKRAAKIAKYHGAVGILLNDGKSHNIQKFENETITDTKRKTHKFETRKEKLEEIAEKREETEFFSIYTGA